MCWGHCVGKTKIHPAGIFGKESDDGSLERWGNFGILQVEELIVAMPN